MRAARLASIATGSVLAALLGACTNPTLAPSAQLGSYPVAQVAPVPVEDGRVTGIEFYQAGVATGGANVPGAIVGAVAGAVIGNQVGRAIGDRSRNAATVLGGIGGAAVGSQVGAPTTSVTAPVYRITVQTDQGAVRVFDVPAPGDLHLGDRVRVENGVIHRF
jgi:outer membrane lipoprotein SlyB